MEGSSFKSFLKKNLANGELAPFRLFKKVCVFDSSQRVVRRLLVPFHSLARHVSRIKNFISVLKGKFGSDV